MSALRRPTVGEAGLLASLAVCGWVLVGPAQEAREPVRPVAAAAPAADPVRADPFGGRAWGAGSDPAASTDASPGAGTVQSAGTAVANALPEVAQGAAALPPVPATVPGTAAAPPPLVQAPSATEAPAAVTAPGVPPWPAQDPAEEHTPG